MPVSPQIWKIISKKLEIAKIFMFLSEAKFDDKKEHM